MLFVFDGLYEIESEIIIKKNKKNKKEKELRKRFEKSSSHINKRQRFGKMKRQRTLGMVIFYYTYI